MAGAEVNAALLKGLTFRTNEERTVEEEGKKVKRYYPIERPLTPADVLAVKDLGDTVVIVAGDGRKHRVAKAAVGKKE
jgi:hypothetical protein